MKLRSLAWPSGLFVSAAPGVSLADGALAATDPLYQKILALDTEMFEAFNTCADLAKLARHESFFVKELEFYHDNGGATFTRDDYMKGVKNQQRTWRRCAEMGSQAILIRSASHLARCTA